MSLSVSALHRQRPAAAQAGLPPTPRQPAPARHGGAPGVGGRVGVRTVTSGSRMTSSGHNHPNWRNVNPNKDSLRHFLHAVTSTPERVDSWDSTRGPCTLSPGITAPLFDAHTAGTGRPRAHHLAYGCRDHCALPGADQPGPRTTRPGFAPVCSPSRRTCTPLTNTSLTPVAYCIGFSKVAWSRMVSGSKTTMSA